MMNLFYAKRIVSIVTILLVLLFVFTGCSSMNPDDKNTGNGGDGGIIGGEDGIEGVIEFTLATVPNPAPIKNTWRVTDAGSPTSEDFTDLMVALQSVKKPRVKLEFPNIIAIPENPKPPTEHLTGLISLSAPKATSIGSLTGYGAGAFAYQINLTTVDIPEAITIGNEAFYGCALTSIDLPKATAIGSWAFGFTSLTKVDFLEAIEIGKSAFNGCTSLTSVDLPKATILKSADDWGSAFKDCTSLTTVNLPKAITIGPSTFQGCTSLTSIDLPEATTFGHYGTFKDCTSLTSVNLPKAIDIRNFIFDDCTSLISVNLPKATHIGTGAFDQCIKLTDIIIGTESASLYVFRDAFASAGSGHVSDDRLPKNFLNTTITTAHGEAVGEAPKEKTVWSIIEDLGGVNISRHGRFKEIIIK